jgi:hypothetical protein
MLNLSVIPSAGGLDLIWFLNGQTYSVSHIGNISPDIVESGTAVINFDGIIDEFGVYFRDNAPSVNPYIFYNAMKLKYKSNLLFADGFDSNTITGNFSVNSNPFINSGILELKSGQTLILPEMIRPRSENSNIISIIFNPPAGLTYSYSDSLLEIKASGNELIEKISRLDLTVNDSSVTLSGTAYTLTDEESIRIKIINSTESNIFIDSLMARTE